MMPRCENPSCRRFMRPSRSYCCLRCAYAMDFSGDGATAESAAHKGKIVNVSLASELTPLTRGLPPDDDEE